MCRSLGEKIAVILNLFQDLKSEIPKRVWDDNRIFSLYTHSMFRKFLVLILFAVPLEAADPAAIDNFLTAAPVNIRQVLRPQLLMDCWGCKEEERRFVTTPLPKAAVTYLLDHLDELYQACPHLKGIYLNKRRLSDQQLVALMRFERLKFLTLKKAKLRILPSKIGDLTSLEYLDLSGNSLTTLPPSMKELRHLGSLKIEICRDFTLPPELRRTMSAFGKERVDRWVRKYHLNAFMQGAPASLRGKYQQFLLGFFSEVDNKLCYAPRKMWTDEEKAFIASKFDQLQNLYWLEALNLDGFGLKEIPSWVSDFEDLEFLSLRNNELEALPEDLTKLEGLQILNLGNNKFRVLPEVVLSCERLRKLELSHNFLSRFVITDDNALPALTALVVEHNLINEFQLGTAAPHLKVINLTGNRLSDFPCVDHQLNEIGMVILGHNQFTRFPEEIALKPSLNTLVLACNYLKDVPESVNQRERSLTLNCSANPSFRGVRVGGQYSVEPLHSYRAFECCVRNGGDDSRHVCGKDFVDERTFFDRLESDWNIEALKGVKSVAIPPQDVTAEVVFGLWQEMWGSLNLDQPEEEGVPNETYQDFALFEPFLASSARVVPESGANKEKMEQGLLPHLDGFIKTLFGLPLADGETRGWQIAKADIPATQQYAAFLIKAMFEDKNLAMFMQFVGAILYCPTGQKTAFETMTLNACKTGEENLENLENLETRIKKILGAEKEKAFLTTVNQTQFGQAVHLVEHYRLQLADKLGLVSMIKSYRDNSSIPRSRDLFHGNLVKVLEAFYGRFTVDFFVDRLMNHTETAEDRVLKSKTVKTDDEKKDVKRRVALRPITISSLLDFLNRSELIPYAAYAEQVGDEPAMAVPWSFYFTENPTQDEKPAEVKAALFRAVLEEMGLV